MIKLVLKRVANRVIRRSIRRKGLGAFVSFSLVGEAAAADDPVLCVDKLHDEILTVVAGRRLVVESDDSEFVEDGAARKSLAIGIHSVADGTEREEMVFSGDVAGNGREGSGIARIDARE